jgi:hypothetical protein
MKFTKIVAMIILCVFVIFSAALIFDPLLYGKSIGPVANRLIDIWAGLVGVVIGYFFRNPEQSKPSLSKSPEK